MALLSREMYKLIEGKLHNRYNMQDEVIIWFAGKRYELFPDDMALSRKISEVSGGKTNGKSDTTAMTVIKRMHIPKHIREAQRWLKIIGIVESRYAGTPKGMLLDAYYDGSPKGKGRIQSVCDKLCIEQATAYNWRDEIVNFAALVSATENVIKKF